MPWHGHVTAGRSIADSVLNRVISMSIQDRMDSALRLPQPGQAFRDLVTELAREGYEKKQILQFLEHTILEQQI